MQDAVLALNAGSSSIKFALFSLEAADALTLACSGQVEGIGGAPHFIARDSAGTTLADQRWDAGAGIGHEALLDVLIGFVGQHRGAMRLLAVGHRVVHGGRSFARPALVDAAVLEQLDALTPLAPLHQPHNLSPIRVLAAHRPDLPQVACFDTAFHHDMPEVAARFALPRKFETDGVRRYGFHGLSYEFIARRLRVLAPELASGRVIVAHLGNGASLCAMCDGHSIDTTMGFTALDGLMMGTRCGNIDPGVLLYMLNERGMSGADVEDVLYHRAGLLGVSGLSNDMRTLLGSDDPYAREAIELFVYRVARDAGALASSLGGLDGFVFTAGIGEHAAPVRAAVCARLAWLGVELDAEKNAKDAGRISTARSHVDVRVVPTDEEAMIARHALETVRAASKT